MIYTEVERIDRKKEEEIAMTIKAIKEMCKNGMPFTSEMMINEIKERISKNELLCSIWEAGMRAASNDDERKCVICAIMELDGEIKEIFKTFLYYKMREMD